MLFVPPRQQRLSITYVACELVDGAILGHVVFFVWIILWEGKKTAPGSQKRALTIGLWFTVSPSWSSYGATSWYIGVMLPLSLRS